MANRKRPAASVASDSDAAFDRRYQRALATAAAERQAGLVAVTARYDAADRVLMITMSDRLRFGIPLDRLPQLARATDEQIADVIVMPGGHGLVWDALDVDFSVLGMLFEIFGHSALSRAASAAGGRAKTHAKAKAARANGKKGGRPRKKHRSAA